MSDTLFKVKRLHDLAQAGLLKGKRVLIRSDLNVPQDEAGNITEDTRIRASIPAIEICLESWRIDRLQDKLDKQSHFNKSAIFKRYYIFQNKKRC
jgi:hypothetical protein